MEAALLAAGISPGFQSSKDFLFWFAKLAAAPAEESGSVRPTTGKAGRSRGSACLSEVAAPVIKCEPGAVSRRHDFALPADESLLCSSRG